MSDRNRNTRLLLQALSGACFVAIGILGLFDGVTFAAGAGLLFGLLLILSAWHSGRAPLANSITGADEWRTIVIYSLVFLALGSATLAVGIMKGGWYLPVSVAGFIASTYIGVGLPVGAIRAQRKT
jgi:hypothetical protein